MLDPVESTAGRTSHATLSRDTSMKRAGAASLKSVGSGTDRFRKALSEPIDISQMHYLTFWYYIDDPTKITGGQIEIT